MKKETKRNIGIAGGIGATGLLAAGILNRKRISSHFRTLANGKKVPVKGNKRSAARKESTNRMLANRRRMEEAISNDPSLGIPLKNQRARLDELRQASAKTVKDSDERKELVPKIRAVQKQIRQNLNTLRTVKGLGKKDTFNNSFVGLIEFNRNYQGIRQQGRIDARQGTGKQGTRFGLKASKALAQTSVDTLRATGAYTRGRADVALNRAKKSLTRKFRNRKG